MRFEILFYLFLLNRIGVLFYFNYITDLEHVSNLTYCGYLPSFRPTAIPITAVVIINNHIVSRKYNHKVYCLILTNLLSKLCVKHARLCEYI